MVADPDGQWVPFPYYDRDASSVVELRKLVYKLRRRLPRGGRPTESRGLGRCAGFLHGRRR